MPSLRHIETQIRQAVPYVERVLIHAEPMERTYLRYAVPLADHDGTISEHLGEAPYLPWSQCVWPTAPLRSSRSSLTLKRTWREQRASAWPSGSLIRRWT